MCKNCIVYIYTFKEQVLEMRKLKFVLIVTTVRHYPCHLAPSIAFVFSTPLASLFCCTFPFRFVKLFQLACSAETCMQDGHTFILGSVTLPTLLPSGRHLENVKARL